MDYYHEKIEPVIEKVEKEHPFCGGCDGGLYDHEYQDYMVISKICDCLKKRRYYKSLAEAGIPKYYWDLYDRELHFENNKRKIYKILNEPHDESHGAVFYGPSFTGKTFAAIFILIKRIIEEDLSGYWWKHSTLMPLLYQAKVDQELFDYIQQTLSRDVVVIDELGWSTYRNQDIILTETMRLMRQVYEQGSQLFVTTNYPPKDIEEKYGPPLYNTLFRTEIKALNFKEVYGKQKI